MANNQPQYKILAVERILQENPKGLTVKEIIKKLDYEYGVKAERKAIYNNMYVLGWFLPIRVRKHGIENIYYIEQFNQNTQN